MGRRRHIKVGDMFIMCDEDVLDKHYILRVTEIDTKNQRDESMKYQVLANELVYDDAKKEVAVHDMGIFFTGEHFLTHRCECISCIEEVFPSE